MIRAVAAALALALFVGCGDAETRPPVPFGAGGSGGSSGSGGSAGAGGMGGVSGMGGTGSVTGTGGMLGTGGTAGTGGGAGAGGSMGGCLTNALCHACPTTTCDVDDDCAGPGMLPGLVCVPTGCTFDGEPQKECQPARYISCDVAGDCPSSDYECKAVGGPLRCVPKTPGCAPSTEDYDCPPGFSCEDGACVDRRVPCDTATDCPKNHVCFNVQNASTSKFCVNVFRSCHDDTDCSFLGSWCADVDGDGRKECTGDLSDAACVNAVCDEASAPVCEPGFTGTNATCGQYGLCLDDGDCAGSFACTGLWQDGRNECVPAGGTCDQVTACPPNQVCAAPRGGGSPRCQAGKEAM